MVLKSLRGQWRRRIAYFGHGANFHELFSAMAKFIMKMMKEAKRNVIDDRRSFEHIFQLMTKTFAYQKVANVFYESRFVVKTNCFHESIFTIFLRKIATAKVQMDLSVFCRKNSGMGGG